MTVTEETQIDTVPGLSIKTRAGLASANIKTVKDAINHSMRFYLKKIDNFSLTQYGNLATVLGGYGFKIPDTIIHERFSVLLNCINPLCLHEFTVTFEPGSYQDYELEAKCPKCGFHTKVHKVTKVCDNSIVEEESIWNDASLELSRLILNGYTIEDICDELSMDPLIIHVLNAIVPLAHETTKILKELERVKILLKKCIKPSEPGNDIVKGKQLHLMAKNLVSLGEVKTYTKEYCVSWTPEEDEVLRYLEKRGLSTTYIPLLFPRTQSSIVQRYRTSRIKNGISYRTRSLKPKKYNKIIKEKRGINMSNINTMLTSLSETVFSMIAAGKTIDEISTELAVDKNWIDLIIASRDSADELIYNEIVNDKTFEINSKNDIIKKTHLNLDQINVSLARLLSQHRLPYATLWKRQLLPPTINAFHDNPDYFYKEYMDGCTLEYMSYITKTNPDSFRRLLGGYREEKNLTNRTDTESDKNYNQVFSRNRSLLRYIKFIEFHFEDLSKDLDDSSESILYNNLEKLKAELVECYDDEQPVVTAEPQKDTSVEDVVDEHVEEFNDIIDEHFEKFVDIINESTLEAVKDPATEEITEYHGLVEHEDTDEIEEPDTTCLDDQPVEEPKPKNERPSYLRRKDEWTDEQLSILKEMAVKGCTAKDISQVDIMKNRSVNAIGVMISNLRNKGEIPDKEKKKTKIDPKSRNDLWTEDSVNKLIEMHNDGASNVSIAYALNRTTGAVGFKIHMLRKEGKLPPINSEETARFRHKSIWTDEELETIKRMIKEGVRVKDILPHLPNKKRSQVDSKIAEMRRTGKL